ncbi:hypothetical protein Tco_0888067 [Tanacetum coccineum]
MSPGITTLSKSRSGPSLWRLKSDNKKKLCDIHPPQPAPPAPPPQNPPPPPPPLTTEPTTTHLRHSHEHTSTGRAESRAENDPIAENEPRAETELGERAETEAVGADHNPRQPKTETRAR